MLPGSNLAEGLKRLALDDLVLPLISIDEYESKISDRRAIVIGFYVTDEDPAIDLSNFIDRGPQPIMDTEVSPAPTPEGQFVVFVEVMRNGEFPNVLLEILNEIANVTSILDWKFICPAHQNALPVTTENLHQHIVLDPDDIVDVDDDDTNQIEKQLSESRKFWQNACVDHIELDSDGHLIMHSNGSEHHFMFLPVTEGTMHPAHKNGLDTKMIGSMLGIDYDVCGSNDGFLVSNGEKTVLLKKIP